MKYIQTLLAGMAIAMSAPQIVSAQKSGFSYNFYGFVRNDIFLSTRQSQTSEEGSFYLFPLDHDYDVNGKDVNAGLDLNMYNMRTRLGVNVTGPEILGAKTSATVEMDFRGNGSNVGLIRVRHAYFNLDWGTSSLLLGQTWHPLYGNVTPEILDINSGAPYNPDDRAPQIRYRYDNQGFMLTAAAAWQAQNKSVGPNGSSSEYLRKSGIPELFLGLDYHDQYFTIGVGAELLSLKMRDKTEMGNKVNERFTTISAEAHVKYKKDKFLIAAKSFLTSNMTMLNTLGGYGVSSVDSRTGKREYSPLRISHSWLNIGYGTDWRLNFLGGYAKNFGASKAVSELTGMGTNIDQTLTGVIGLSRTWSHLKLGLEYNTTTAWYGSNTSKGRVDNTHAVTNHRLMFTTQYNF
jgi:hypothetical protein